jgi:predicted heme/steroid binding protein
MAAERIVTRQELAVCDGDSGPAFIAYQGVVYDVSGCSRWRQGLHEGMHFPGQDLTGEMQGAPHLEDVFARPCVKRVGILAPPA